MTGKGGDGHMGVQFQYCNRNGDGKLYIYYGLSSELDQSQDRTVKV